MIYSDILYPNERLGIFIDGFSLYSISRALDFNVDFARLLKLFQNPDLETKIIRANYYVCTFDSSDGSEDPLRPLLDWLQFNGYRLVHKPKKSFTDQSGTARNKSSINVELAIDLLEQSDYIDHAILFTGDSDLRYAVEAAQRKGKRVTAISTLSKDHTAISDDLRKTVDAFIDITDIKSLIERVDRKR